MPLTVNQSGGGQTLGEEFMPKAWIKEVQTKAVVDYSGKPNNWGTVNDLALEFELEEGSFTRKVTMQGNFRKAEGKVDDWGGTFPIRDLLFKSDYWKNLANTEKDQVLSMLEKSEVPAGFLAYLTNGSGKVYRIIYQGADGKLKSFNKVSQDKEQLERLFKSGLPNFPSNYDPEATPASKDEDTSFKYGANVTPPEEVDTI